MKTIKEKSGLKTPRESIGNSGKQKMNYNNKKGTVVRSPGHVSFIPADTCRHHPFVKQPLTSPPHDPCRLLS